MNDGDRYARSVANAVRRGGRDEWVPTLRHVAEDGQILVIGVTAFLRQRRAEIPLGC